MLWAQNYDPLGSPWLSTVFAAIPLVVLLGTLAFLRWRAPVAALAGLAAALLIAVVVFDMPALHALAAAGFGAAYGLLPIGWIVLNIHLHVTANAGARAVRDPADSISGITDDSRLQLCSSRSLAPF